MKSTLIARRSLWPAFLLFLPLTVAAAEVTVYKSRLCGCCNGWIAHLSRNGFSVKGEDVPDLSAIKRNHGVPDELVSCHTAVVDGYVVEGHVPASTIKRLLRERPAVAGISAPGMPQGSPGMESATPEAFDVVAFDAQGRVTVFERIVPQASAAERSRQGSRDRE